MFRCCLGRGVILLTGGHSPVVDGCGEWVVVESRRQQGSMQQRKLLQAYESAAPKVVSDSLLQDCSSQLLSS